MAAMMAMARPVDVQRARALVEAHYFAPAVCVSPAGWDELYVFVPAEGEGFVIVAADDCVRPVLAYSATGQFPVDDMPAHVAAWLAGYQREIAEYVKNGAEPSAAVQALWQQPKSGGLVPVEPLMTTTWNQAPLYNSMCPYSYSDTAHAVTGCVATAQAQVMKYWNHPAVGHGSHSYVDDTFGPQAVTFDTAYRWAQMPDALTWESSSEEVNAVAQLMYHVGVAVEMGYGVGSSGAQVISYADYGYNLPSTERSLREHFGYNPMLYGKLKAIYTDEAWDAKLRNEIVRRRPVIYTGFDEAGGHAFVLDGYDSIGMFHVNWGWGGAYDGYYTIDSLSPGAGGIGGNATYTFNRNNSAIFGVMPCDITDSLAHVNFVSADSTMGTVVGSGHYVPYQDQVAVRVLPAEGYRFAGWASGQTNADFTFTPNGDLTDTALFLPVASGDTVGYCDGHLSGSWRDDYGNITEWGIRIPASLRQAQRSLSAVQLYVRDGGIYTLRVYAGDSICSANLLRAVGLDLTSASGWTTADLDEPIALPNGVPVWVTFRFTSSSAFPATGSYYTAVEDGSWYRMPDGWVPITRTGAYYSWMIRAIFAERPCRVAVENAGQCELDNLYGAGEYAVGDTVTVGCDDPYFTHWEGIGSTARSLTFVAVRDTAFYAYCHDVGIDEAALPPVRVSLQGRSLTAECDAADTPLLLYDMQGRCLATAPGRLCVALPARGVYMLRAGSACRKITVF